MATERRSLITIGLRAAEPYLVIDPTHEDTQKLATTNAVAVVRHEDGRKPKKDGAPILTRFRPPGA